MAIYMVEAISSLNLNRSCFCVVIDVVNSLLSVRHNTYVLSFQLVKLLSCR